MTPKKHKRLGYTPKWRFDAKDDKMDTVQSILGGLDVRKEFEIQGCVEVPETLSYDEFYDAFIEFIEQNGWSFGGGINEINDGYYINADGTKGKHVLDD